MSLRATVERKGHEVVAVVVKPDGLLKKGVRFEVVTGELQQTRGLLCHPEGLTQLGVNSLTQFQTLLFAADPAFSLPVLWPNSMS